MKAAEDALTWIETFATTFIESHRRERFIFLARGALEVSTSAPRQRLKRKGERDSFLSSLEHYVVTDTKRVVQSPLSYGVSELAPIKDSVLALCVGPHPTSGWKEPGELALELAASPRSTVLVLIEGGTSALYRHGEIVDASFVLKRRGST